MFSLHEKYNIKLLKCFILILQWCGKAKPTAYIDTGINKILFYILFIFELCLLKTRLSKGSNGGSINQLDKKGGSADTINDGS